MKKCRLLIIMLLLVQAKAFAQREDYIWAFGKNAGINFNSGTAVAVTGAVSSQEASASVCTPTGQLQFSTDGSRIWDRNGTVMPNANPLIVANNIYGVAATASTSQGALIVPLPDSANKYYLFSLTQVEELTNPGSLYYTVVDMSLNGGFGDAVVGRRAILMDVGLNEKMTAVVGNHCNIWLIVHSKNSTTFKAFEITKAGVATAPVVSNIGTMGANTYDVGWIKASHDGKRLVACNVPQTGTGGVEMFDFDAATGIISNAQKLDDGFYYGAAFSPDDTKLYTTSPSKYVYQFNLSAGTLAAIKASKYQVGTLPAGSVAGGLKLGPNGRIYCGGGGNVMATVDLPNVAAPGCAYNASGLTLVAGTNVNLGMPSDVLVLRKDTVTINKQYTVCYKDNLTLQATATDGWNYQWSGGGTTSSNQVTNSGTYVVTYFTANCTYHIDSFIVKFSSPLPATSYYSGCKTFGNSLLWVTPVSGDTTEYTYVWRDAASQVLQTHARTGADTLYNPVAGTYTVSIKQYLGCDTTLTITLPAGGSNVSFTVDTIACTGDLLQFTNTSSSDITTAAWDFGDTATSVLFNTEHTYTQVGAFLVRLIGGPCTDTAYATVQVDPLPVVMLPADTTLCYNSRLLLLPAVLPAEYSAYTYKWTPATAVTNDAIRTPTFISSSTQQVKLTVTTLLGCTGADSMDISVHADHFMKVNDTAICPLDTVQLHASGATSYHWLAKGAYISDTSVAAPFVSPARTHEYIVWGNDTTICTDTAYAQVMVHPAAMIWLPDSITIYAGEQVEAPTQTNCEYVNWFPYLGLSNHSLSNPMISPEASTRYVITGATEAGCIAADTMDVFVNNGAVLTLPNAFVPGNGPNALLKPIYRGLVHLDYFRVYNRWGAKMYESNDLNAGWDGMSNGTPQPADVYVYVIEGTVTGNKKVMKQGNVTLLR